MLKAWACRLLALKVLGFIHYLRQGPSDTELIASLVLVDTLNSLFMMVHSSLSRARDKALLLLSGLPWTFFHFLKARAKFVFSFLERIQVRCIRDSIGDKYARSNGDSDLRLILVGLGLA